MDAPNVVHADDPDPDKTSDAAPSESVNAQDQKAVGPLGLSDPGGAADADQPAAAKPDEDTDHLPAAAIDAEETGVPVDEEPTVPSEPDEGSTTDETVPAPEEDEAPKAETVVPQEPAEDAGETSMMALLMEGGDFLPESHQRGDLVTGTVLRKDDNQIILDIGAKQEGVVPSSDLVRLPANVVEEIEVGSQVEAIVLRPEGREGGVLVSLSQARALADWNLAHNCMDSGEILELEVVGQNKGGALVAFHNLQGFVPRSHLVRLASVNDPDAVARGLSQLVGEQLPVKVIEVSRRKRRLIMSERLAVREWRSEQKRRLLEQLHEGEVHEGRVSSIADFGVFVDLGGADGLVHVSELTHERGRHPRDVVKVGQEVQVYVLNIDRERKRIGLSMKRLQSDPWATVEEDHYVGELVEVTVSNLAKFGAFARLEDGLEGLIHISELSDSHIEQPREAVGPGVKVTVEIIAIEPERQRVGLSIRRVPHHLRTYEEPEAEEPAEEAAPAVQAPEEHAEPVSDEPAVDVPEPEAETEPEAEAESDGEPGPADEEAKPPEDDEPDASSDDGPGFSDEAQQAGEAAEDAEPEPAGEEQSELARSDAAAEEAPEDDTDEPPNDAAAIGETDDPVEVDGPED